MSARGKKDAPGHHVINEGVLGEGGGGRIERGEQGLTDALMAGPANVLARERLWSIYIHLR